MSGCKGNSRHRKKYRTMAEVLPGDKPSKLITPCYGLYGKERVSPVPIVSF